jgi:hypothetical protein
MKGILSEWLQKPYFRGKRKLEEPRHIYVVPLITLQIRGMMKLDRSTSHEYHRNTDA